MIKRRRVALVLPVVSTWLVAALSPVRAADTVETWDPGATEVEFYLGYDGIGLAWPGQTVFADLLLGYGIVDRFSAYLGVSLQGDGSLGNGEAGVYTGVFGTAVDTDHFDLDFLLNFGVGGAGLSELLVLPAAELNFDLDPQRRSFGAYLRVGVPVHGENRDSEASDDGGYRTVFDVVLNPGIYVTFAERHQLLLEYNMAFHVQSFEAHRVSLGGVALGYNVVLSERIELITQIYLHVPQFDDPASVGFMTGFVATLPAG